MREETSAGLSRRDMLKLGVGTAAGVGALAALETLPAAIATAAPTRFEEMTVAEMQAGIAAGTLTSGDLVNFYLTPIQTLDQHRPTLNSLLGGNPDAQALATSLAAQRQAPHPPR